MRSAYGRKNAGRSEIGHNHSESKQRAQRVFEYVADMAREMAEISEGGGNGFLSELFLRAADEADLTIGRLH